MILVYKTEKNRWLITHRGKNYIEFGGLSLLRLFHHLIQKDRAAWLVKLMEGSIRCSANYIPLSPISFLERSAIVYRDRPSVVYGSIIYTWRETLERCTRLASALSQLGISRGDVVCNKLLISCYCKSFALFVPIIDYFAICIFIFYGFSGLICLFAFLCFLWGMFGFVTCPNIQST